MKLFGLTGKEDWFQPIPKYRSAWPWVGADLQTMRNRYRDNPTLAADRYHFADIDGGGQQLAVAVNEPATATNRSLLLVHGLGGSENSNYMIRTAQIMLEAGWRVYRLSLRSVGRSAEISHGPYTGAITDDLRDVLTSLTGDEDLGVLSLMGFSLGGHLVLRMLAEGNLPAKIDRAFTVSAPLDLKASDRALGRRRNRVYGNYVFRLMRRDFKPGPTTKLTRPLEEFQHMRDFSDHMVAPTFGYESIDDLYAELNVLQILDKIQVPTLAVHAANDSWIPAKAYKQGQWTGLPHGAAAILVRGGGHLGFHARGLDIQWYDYVARCFLNATL